MRDGALQAVLGESVGPVTALAFGDGNTLHVARNGVVSTYSTKTGELQGERRVLNRPVHGLVCFDGQIFAWGGGELGQFDSGSGVFKTTLTSNGGPFRILALAVSRPGDDGWWRLCVATSNCDVLQAEGSNVAGAAFTTQTASFKAQMGDLRCASLSGAACVAGDAFGRLAVDDRAVDAGDIAESRHAVVREDAHGGVVTSVRWVCRRGAEVVSSDAATIVSTSDDRSIKCWVYEGRSLQLQWTGVGHSARCWGASGLIQGRWVASCSQDGTSVVWNVKDGGQKTILKGHAGKHVWCVEALGDVLSTGGQDGTARLWSLDQALETTAAPQTATSDSTTAATTAPIAGEASERRADARTMIVNVPGPAPSKRGPGSATFAGDAFAGDGASPNPALPRASGSVTCIRILAPSRAAPELRLLVAFEATDAAAAESQVWLFRDTPSDETPADRWRRIDAVGCAGWRSARCISLDSDARSIDAAVTGTSHAALCGSDGILVVNCGDAALEACIPQRGAVGCWFIQAEPVQSEPSRDDCDDGSLTIAISGADRALTLWSAPSSRAGGLIFDPTLTFRVGDAAFTTAVIRCDASLVVGDSRGWLHRFRADGHGKVRLSKNSGCVISLTASEGSKAAKGGLKSVRCVTAGAKVVYVSLGDSLDKTAEAQLKALGPVSKVSSGSPDDSSTACGFVGNRLVVADVETGAVKMDVAKAGHGRRAHDLTDAHAVYCQEDGRIGIVAFAPSKTGPRQLGSRLVADGVVGARYLDDEKLLITGGSGEIGILSTDGSLNLLESAEHPERALAVCGAFVATAGGSNVLRVWDSKRARLVKVSDVPLFQHRSQDQRVLSAVAWGDPVTVALGDTCGVVTFLRLSSKTQRAVSWDSAPVVSLARCAECAGAARRLVFAGSTTGHVIVWDVSENWTCGNDIQVLIALRPHCAGVNALAAFSVLGDEVVVCGGGDDHVMSFVQLLLAAPAALIDAPPTGDAAGGVPAGSDAGDGRSGAAARGAGRQKPAACAVTLLERHGAAQLKHLQFSQAIFSSTAQDARRLYGVGTDAVLHVWRVRPAERAALRTGWTNVASTSPRANADGLDLLFLLAFELDLGDVAGFDVRPAREGGGGEDRLVVFGYSGIAFVDVSQDGTVAVRARPDAACAPQPPPPKVPPSSSCKCWR